MHTLVAVDLRTSTATDGGNGARAIQHTLHVNLFVVVVGRQTPTQHTVKIETDNDLEKKKSTAIQGCCHQHPRRP